MMTRSKNPMQVLIVLLWLAFYAAAAAAGHVVAIDPAHGGDDTGVKLSRGVYEKDVTLAVAKFVQVNLSESGVQVRLTRSDDRALSLLERAANNRLREVRRAGLLARLKVLWGKE